MKPYLGKLTLLERNKHIRDTTFPQRSDQQRGGEGRGKTRVTEARNQPWGERRRAQSAELLHGDGGRGKGAGGGPAGRGLLRRIVLRRRVRRGVLRRRGKRREDLFAGGLEEEERKKKVRCGGPETWSRSAARVVGVLLLQA